MTSSSDFWTLPLEIRTRIYVESFRHWARKQTIRLYRPWIRPFNAPHRQTYWVPQLLHVSKRIQAEAGEVFYSSRPLTLILAIDQIPQMALRASRPYVGSLEIWDATLGEIASFKRSGMLREPLGRKLSRALVELFPNLRNMKLAFESISNKYTVPEWRSLVQELSSPRLTLSMNLRVACGNEETCKATLENLRALSGLPRLQQLRLDMYTPHLEGYNMHPFDIRPAREEILKGKTILQPFLTELMAALPQVQKYELRRVMHGCTRDAFIGTSGEEMFANIEELERRPRPPPVDIKAVLHRYSLIEEGYI